MFGLAWAESVNFKKNNTYVQVEGANGYEATDYNLYVWEVDTPLETTTDFRVWFK